MRFARIHKAATFSMVLSSLGALLLSGHIPALMSIILLAAFLGAIPVPRSWMRSRHWQTAWTIATLGAFFLCVLQIAVGGGFVEAAIYFLLFLVINKLYNRQKGRDHLQLYAVSLMSVVAGAAINMGPSYLFCFVLHTIFGVWSLILFQLRREMEENYLLRHADNTSSERVAVDRVLRSRRIVGWSFLGFTGLGAFSVLVFASLLFLFFPRIGLTRWGWGRQGNPPMVGFSNSVQLGKHGRLRDNPRVVMRVRFSQKIAPSALKTILWRGMTFDRYLGGRWSRSSNLPWPDAHRVENMTVLLRSPETNQERSEINRALRDSVKYTVMLMPLVGGVLPMIDLPLAVSMDGKYPGMKAEIVVAPGKILDNPRPGKIVKYQGWSIFPQRLSSAMKKKKRKTGDNIKHSKRQPGFFDTQPLTREEKRTYLSLPGGLPHSFFSLANRLKGDKKANREIIRAAMEYMSPKNGFSYSRNLTQVPRGHDPVAHFLLRNKTGHCEYYASSLALLGRAMDVPTRLVTGFLGGEWNEYGDFLGVRQGDAHAWVEAYIPTQGGWVTFDPTPPAGRVPASEKGVLARIGLWLDNLKLGYLHWIVDYDVHSQWSLASGARGWLRKRTPSGFPWKLLLWILAFLTSGVALSYVFKVLYGKLEKFQKTKAQKTNDPAGSAYERLLSVLAEKGFTRQQNETPREFASQLTPADLPATPIILEATEAYYSARYGKGDPSKVQRLVDEIIYNLSRKTS